MNLNENKFSELTSLLEAKTRANLSKMIFSSIIPLMLFGAYNYFTINHINNLNLELKKVGTISEGRIIIDTVYINETDDKTVKTLTENLNNAQSNLEALRDKLNNKERDFNNLQSNYDELKSSNSKSDDAKNPVQKKTPVQSELSDCITKLNDKENENRKLNSLLDSCRRDLKKYKSKQ